MSTSDPNQAFRDAVELSKLVDPRPTLENLARNTGLTYEDIVHHALERYASSGAEALLAIDPYALRELIEARSHVEPIVAGLCAGRLGPADRVASGLAWLVIHRAVREKLGLLRARALLCDGEPVSPATADWFAALGVPVRPVHPQ